MNDAVFGSRMNQYFARVASYTAIALGSAQAFVASCVLVLVWALLGPVFDFSTTWQLLINTGTTIATFLMVFIVQNTQNRDALAIHIKLDELLRAVAEARTDLADAEDRDEVELRDIKREIVRCESRL